MTWAACAGHGPAGKVRGRLAGAVLLGVALAGPLAAQTDDAGEPPPMPRRRPLWSAETLMLIRSVPAEPVPVQDEDVARRPPSRSPAETLLLLRVSAGADAAAPPAVAPLLPAVETAPAAR